MDPTETLLQALIVLETGELVRPGSEWVTMILERASSDVGDALYQCTHLAVADITDPDGDVTPQGEQAYSMCMAALADMGIPNPETVYDVEL